jgi:exopolysaccharide production protein ExoQ
MLSMLVASYLSVRFSDEDRMKVLSCAFAISAIGSFLFVLAYPDYGTMHFRVGSEGDWRGVFSHKNALGAAMSVAIFVELYVLASAKRKPLWRFGLLGLYSALLILSRSLTSIISCLIYFAGAVSYLMGKRDKLVGAIVGISLALILLFLQISIWYNPDLLFSFLGKDPTLSGRTDLWLATISLINHKPLLGWGYMATWVPTDPEIASIHKEFHWAVPNAHNAFLDITLQLGLLGLGVLLAIIVIALRRALRCCTRGILPLGWFSLIFLVGTLFLSISESGLGETQAIHWVILNILSFSCGIALAPARHGGSHWGIRLEHTDGRSGVDRHGLLMPDRLSGEGPLSS